VEAQITTIGTILLGVFYAIGYVLNQQAKKHHEEVPSLDRFDSEQTEFLSTLSSTASQSTSLNVLLWQRLTSLEEFQVENEKEIELLKADNQQKEEHIADLEAQIQQLLEQLNPDTYL